MTESKEPAGALAIVPIVGVTLAAALVGMAAESYIMPSLVSQQDSATEIQSADIQEKKNAASKTKSDGNGRPYGKNDATIVALNKTKYVPLDDIIVSLRDERRTRIRIVCIALLPPSLSVEEKVLLAQVQSDIAAYLRTLSIEDIETGIGFTYLRDDLEEIVQVRAQNAKARLMIASIVAE